MKLRRDAGPIVGGPARADLLPDEVRDARHAKSVRHAFELAVVGAVLVAVLAVAGARFVEIASDVALHSARAQTNQLLAQEGKYSSVTVTRNRLADASTARKTATATEILWQPYLDSVEATLPKSVSIANVQITSNTSQTAATPLGPLDQARVATLVFHVSTAHLTAIQAWLNALPAVHGFVDASASNVSADQTGELGADVTLHVGAEAYSAAPASWTALAKLAPTPTAAPSPTPTASAAPAVTATPTPTPTPTKTAKAKKASATSAAQPSATDGSTPGTTPTPKSTAGNGARGDER